VTPRGITWKGKVSAGIGILPLFIKVSSPETGFVSSMSEEDIKIETLEGVIEKSPSEGFQIGF